MGSESVGVLKKVEKKKEGSAEGEGRGNSCSTSKRLCTNTAEELNARLLSKNGWVLAMHNGIPICWSSPEIE